MASLWPVGAPVAALHNAAMELLRAVDEGRPAGQLARALALDVLRATVPDSAPWLLAVAVIEGGVLRARNAVELAGVMLDAIAAEGVTGEGVAETG